MAELPSTLPTTLAAITPWLLERQQDLETSVPLPDPDAAAGAVPARLCATAFLYDGGVAATLVARRAQARTLADLGAPPVLAELAAARAGIVLVAGPGGAGKSATVAALLEAINDGPGRHVLLLQDEAQAPASRRAVFTARELTGAAAVDNALRAAPRQGVDVVVLDPLPDLALLPRLCEVASAGVLVLCGLRAGSSIHAAAQLLSGFPNEAVGQAALSACLRGLIYQTPCRGVGGRWHAAYEVLLDSAERRGASSLDSAKRSGAPFFEGAGLLTALRDPDALAAYVQAGRRRGMQTLSMGLRRLQQSAAITEDELERLDPERHRFQAPSLQDL